MDPRKMPKIVLYSRQGCHLCDDAALLLKRHRLTFETVDIDADEGLRARYNECVPVVVVDGKETHVFPWKIGQLRVAECRACWLLAEVSWDCRWPINWPARGARFG
jgi:glutaredoxin